MALDQMILLQYITIALLLGIVYLLKKIYNIHFPKNNKKSSKVRAKRVTKKKRRKRKR